LTNASLLEYWRRKPLTIWLQSREAKWKVLKGRLKLLWKSEMKGYISSRMQANSWDLSIDQDFRLTRKEGSWITERWPIYAWDFIIPINKINVFIASSFACHDILQEMDRIKKKHRKGEPRVRRKLASRNRSRSTKESD
jgi:hypothetical protein